ncbi:MAG TPA: NADH-quinone oxidoreductase subunit L, partial [Thermoanaerobaculia bacterium]|nr:NADH-quinone oxidoreductase subunit L [Thermoanaerobaculia bacterium]
MSNGSSEGHAAHAAGHDDHGHDDHGHGAHGDIPWKAVHTWVGPVASGLSFVFALLAILSWWKETGGHREIVTTLWTWIPMGTN